MRSELLTVRTAILFLLGLSAIVSSAVAQDAGAVVSASAGVTNLSSRTELTFSGSGGYKFNRNVGVEIEVTAVPTLKSSYPGNEVTILTGNSVSFTSISSPIGGVAPTIFPGPTIANLNGRAVFFTNNLRVELPTGVSRLTPFFVAGGGIGTIRHTADYTYPIGILAPIGVPGGIRTSTVPLTTTATGLALTIGGGLSVRVADHVSIDGDLRLFRLLSDQDTNAGRFLVGVRYRF